MTVTYRPCNECGDREVRLVTPARLFGLVKARTAILVSKQNGGTVWHHKGTGHMAGTMETHECLAAVERHRTSMNAELLR
jgi:hypothetical protein